MKDIKVSVIIPIYNVEKYIEECLCSVINQTLKEIEIICVNDDTPDDSMLLVKKYFIQDDRIVILNKENGGLSSARNYGLAHACGEYIYFLDSDDYILPDTLEILYNEAKINDLDNIFFDAESFFENEKLKEKHKNYLKYYNREHEYSKIVTGIELLNQMNSYDEYRPSACLQMPKRRMLIENGIEFMDGILHEDNLFTFENIIVSKKVKHIGKTFYMRRVREGSIMTDKVTYKNAYGYYMCYLKAIEFYNQNLDMCSTNLGIINILRKMRRNAIVYLKKLNCNQLEKFYSLLDKDQALALKVEIQQENELERIWKGKIKTKNKRIEELKSIKESYAFRLGKIITFFPTKISKFISLIYTRGLKCEMYAIKRKITKEKQNLDGEEILVSIIIPIYNAQKYLAECLESLINQTLKSIEIICINDGSTDESERVLSEYQEFDKRIKVITQENAGAGAARNNGIKYAKGEYLLFLDADDTFDSRMCEKAYYQGKYDMAEIVLFGAKRIDMQNGIIESMSWVLNTKLLPERKPFNVKHVQENKLFQITSGCPWSKLFKREFVLKNELQFQNIKNANDVLFVRTSMALANRITYIEDEFVLYRFNEGTNTQSQKNQYPLEFYKAYTGLKEALIHYNVFEKVEQSYINLALSDSLYNLRTVEDDNEAYQKVKKLLVKEGFYVYGIQNYEKNFFYNLSDYDMYLYLIKRCE